MVSETAIEIEKIRDHITAVFEKDERETVADFIEFLSSSGMFLERGAGYWKDKFYLLAKHQDEVIFYILLNGDEDNSEPKGLTIWSGEDALNRYGVLHPDQKTKETIWKHVDICKNCGGCGNPGGTSKTIFGKEFSNVCITPMRFDNPNAKTLERLKKLATLRKRTEEEEKNRH